MAECDHAEVLARVCDALVAGTLQDERARDQWLALIRERIA